ncbi:MAG: TonB-dependent receptor domain-containing protein [Betaproteobacteria bacterium]
MHPLRTAPRAPLAFAAGLAVLGGLLPTCSHAQGGDLPSVVVVATREAQPLDRVAADVVVIDAERIRDSAADSLEDLLRREAGLQLSRNGGPGQNASVFIRGSAANGTVVLVDGVRVGSATLGQAEFEALGLAQIERIEVLRGPGSSLYGADAVGGVVQIFTRRGEGAPHLAAHAAVGDLRSAESDASVAGTMGRFDFATSLSRERSAGVSALRPGDLFGNFNPDRDGHGRTSAQARVGFAPAAGHHIGASVFESRLDQQFDSAEFAPPDFLPDATPDFRNHLVTRVAALDYHGDLGRGLTTRLQLARSDDDLTSGGRLLDRFITRRDQATWQNAWKPDADQQVVLALERLVERGRSTSFAADVRRDDDGVVLGYSGKFGRHLLQADLRRDDDSQFGAVTTGRLGWSLEVAPGWRVRALTGTTFRAPSFNDLYFPGFGVAGLQPERGRSVEAGLVYRAGETNASATLYRNRVRDLIAYEPDRSFCPADPAYDFGCARNVGRARLQGASLAGARRFGGWHLQASVDFLDASDEATGERLPRRAAHQESLAADWQARGGWSYGAALLVVGARPDAGKQLGAYATLDLQARWRFAPRWRLEARLQNATDRDIEPVRDYRSPGRQAWVGLRYDGRGL